NRDRGRQTDRDPRRSPGQAALLGEDRWPRPVPARPDAPTPVHNSRCRPRRRAQGSQELVAMKLRLIDALQRADVLDGSKWLRLPVPVPGTDRLTTDHDLPTMTVGIDPDRHEAHYCDRIYDPRAIAPTHLGGKAAFTLKMLIGECRLVDAVKGAAW